MRICKFFNYITKARLANLTNIFKAIFDIRKNVVYSNLYFGSNQFIFGNLNLNSFLANKLINTCYDCKSLNIHVFCMYQA